MFVILGGEVFVLLVLCTLPHIKGFVVNFGLSFVGEVGKSQKVSSGGFLLWVVTADILLGHKQIHCFVFVKFDALWFFAELIIALRVDSVFVFSSEKLVGVVVPDLGCWVKFAWISSDMKSLTEMLGPKRCFFLGLDYAQYASQ